MKQNTQSAPLLVFLISNFTQRIPYIRFGSKIRDTDNWVFFTDSHVCSCCGSCHWGGDRGDYFVNTILSSTKSKLFFNYPGPCKWKQLRQEPGQTYRGGRGRFSRTGLPLHCVSFLRNISSSKYIGAKLETKSVTCALCPKTSSWFILQLCTTRSEVVFCFQFTSSSNLSYTLRLSTEYLERARLISIVKFQQNKSNNFNVLRNLGELSHIARCNFSYQPLPTKHHVPKF